MSAPGIPSSTFPTDERQPLLPPPASSAPSSQHIQPQDEENQPTSASYSDSESDSESPDADSESTKPSLGWRWYTFYSALFLTGLIALTLLLKAFIRSGDTDFDLAGALKKALGGGLSGAAAMVLQVLTLMPLRTVMNYQYRYGTSTTQAIHTLSSLGFSRYYQGLTPALIQGPISRFGDTAANAGILALLQSNPILKKLPTLIQTVFASLAAAMFRMILTPIDTLKTTLQTQGREGVDILKARIKRYGIGTLWYGALATAAATFVGHYPWFATYNYLDTHLPTPHGPHQTLLTLSRRALIGFISSIISDTTSNSLRVVKTYRQVNATRISYTSAARAVVAQDGLRGLFGRGLKTRIVANGLQGVMFSVLWRFFMDLWDNKTKKSLY